VTAPAIRHEHRVLPMIVMLRVFFPSVGQTPLPYACLLCADTCSLDMFTTYIQHMYSITKVITIINLHNYL
jgi:hypothetical protein